MPDKRFPIIKSSKVSWWIRLMLFFKKPICGYDFGYEESCVVCMKCFRGKYYITDCKELTGEFDDER
jgi:hypothetical protein